MKKLIIAITICLITFTIIYASGAIDKIGQIEQEDKISQEKQKDIPKDIQMKSKEKVDNKLNEAWKDISETYKINEEDYIRVDLRDIVKFYEGKIEGLSDTEYIAEITPLIKKTFDNAPFGSTIPNLLIKKDKSEIIIAYKLQEGENYLCKYTRKDGSWDEKETKLSGKPQLYKLDPELQDSN